MLYEKSTSNLKQVKDEEQMLLTHMYQRTGLVSLSGLTHLDIGTCTGRYLKWAYDKGCRNIYGIDESKNSIDFCKKNIHFNTSLINGSCANKSTYNKIEKIHSCTVMLGTINHLDELQLISFLRILGDVINFEGVLAVSSWLIPPIGLTIYNNFQAQLLYERSKLLNFNLFELYGFKLINVQYTSHLRINLFINYKNWGVA